MAHDVNEWAARVKRSCFGKCRYRTVEMAKKVAKDALNKRGIELHCYYCPLCGCYHLTKSKDIRGGKSCRVF